MKHYYTINDNSGNHWAVGKNSLQGTILAQIQHDGEQVRIPLTPEQARAFAAELIKSADEIAHSA